MTTATLTAAKTSTPATGWHEHHRRSAVLRRALADLDRTGGTCLPWDDEAAEVFGEPDDLLRALHGLWARRLAATVDTVLELDDGRGAVSDAVLRAWRRCAGSQPGLRALLDRYAGDPALAHAELVEHRRLAGAAGLATLADPWSRSATLGARLADAARR